MHHAVDRLLERFGRVFALPKGLHEGVAQLIGKALGVGLEQVLLHIVEHILNLSLGLLMLLFILLDLLVVALLAALRLLQLPHLFEVLLLLLQVFDGLLLLGVSVRAERLRDSVLQTVVGVLQLVHGLVVPLDLLLDLLILAADDRADDADNSLNNCERYLYDVEDNARVFRCVNGGSHSHGYTSYGLQHRHGRLAHLTEGVLEEGCRVDGILYKLETLLGGLTQLLPVALDLFGRFRRIVARGIEDLPERLAHLLEGVVLCQHVARLVELFADLSQVDGVEDAG